MTGGGGHETPCLDLIFYPFGGFGVEATTPVRCITDSSSGLSRPLPRYYLDFTHRTRGVCPRVLAEILTLREILSAAHSRLN